MAIMATSKAQRAVNTFNTVRNTSSDAFKSVVPLATISNISEISTVLFNDDYTAQYNEFVGNLVNRIFKTVISTRSFNNPLAILKKGNYALGVDIQDIYTNPTEGHDYEMSETAMSEILKIYKGDTKTAYYRRNRRRKFPITIAREELQAAFISWEDFGKFIDSQITAVYNGNYIEEFQWTKQLVDYAYEQNYANVVTLASDITDKESAENFLVDVRATYLNFLLPSTQYNAYQKMNPDDTKAVNTWSQEGGIVLIITNQALSQINVKALASAFNLELADFMGRVISVDKFANPNIKAVLADESFFQIWDNIFRMDQFYNASTMSWNYFLHVWNTFAISPFANVTIFATNDTVAMQSMSFANTSVNVTMGTPQDVTLNITPSNATTPVTFTSSNTDIATVTSSASNTVKITPVAEGTCTVTAESENGKTAEITVNVVGA